MTRSRVLAIRRLGPEPSPRTVEGAAAIRLYSTTGRNVQATPELPPVSQVAWNLLAGSQPHRSARDADTSGHTTQGG